MAPVTVPGMLLLGAGHWLAAQGRREDGTGGLLQGQVGETAEQHINQSCLVSLQLEDQRSKLFEDFLLSDRMDAMM